MWTACFYGQFYQKIEPKVYFRIKYHDNNRKNEKTITRLHFGKCLLNDYLAKMKITDSDKCTSCETAVESVEHFLLSCPHSELCKKVLSTCDQQKISPTIENILSYKSVIRVITHNIKRKI